MLVEISKYDNRNDNRYKYYLDNYSDYHDDRYNERRRRRERNDKPQHRGKFSVKITSLPPKYSWQNLKDLMRKAGEVVFTEVRGSEG